MEFKPAVRVAEADELAWINARYSEVDFVPAKPGRDLIAVCEIGSNRVGLGRLVPLTADAAELGGMYVFDAYRGRGYAELIVSFLLEQATTYANVWCLPFAHLADFYQRFGFQIPDPRNNPPPEIKEKHEMCLKRYAPTTLLLVRFGIAARS